MRKQLTLKKLTLFVLSTLLCLLLAIAGITLGSSTQAFADEPTAAPDSPAENPSGHDATHTLQAQHVIYPATCVEPGIAVAYCETCGCNVSVVLPADGKSHSVPLKLKDTGGAATIDNTDGKCELCGAVTGGYNKEVVKGTDEEHPTHVEVTAIKDSELTSITIPATVDVEGVGKDLPVHVKEGAFEGNDTIKEVTIQGAVEVGENAFKDCPNLDTLTIQNGTEIIGKNAFEGCEKIAKVELPASVVSIGEDAFKGTAFYYDTSKWTAGEGLKSLVANDCLLEVATAVPEKSAAPSHGRRNAPTDPIASYTVADEIKVIADGALKTLTSLKEVHLPVGLKTVGKDAFNNSVTTIYIGSKDVTVTDATAYTKVDGLNYAATSEVDIYYWGDYDKALNRLADIARLRFHSETEPNDEHHNYWHDVGGTPTAWAHLTELKVTQKTTQFFRGDDFQDPKLKVEAHYDDGSTKPLTKGDYETEPKLKEWHDGNYYLDLSVFNKDKAGTSIVTIKYLYQEVSYEVSVDDAFKVTVKDRGTEETHAVTKGESYTLPAAPERPTGYDFAGWLIEGLDGYTEAQPAQTVIPADKVKNDFTITAQWTARKPSGKFFYGEGVTITNEVEINFTVGELVENKYTVQIIGTPHRVGYSFKGWTYVLTSQIETATPTDMEGTTFEITLSDDMAYTVTAKWTPIDYTFTVKPAEGDAVNYNATYDTSKQVYHITDTVEFTVAANNGYKLISVKNGETDLGIGGTYSVTFGAANITVTVTVEAVKVDLSVEGADKSNVTLTRENNGATANFALTDPTKDNYRFDGWTITVDGAEKVKNYKGNSYSIDLEHADVNVTFTANWVEQVTVTYVLGDHAASDATQPDAKTVDINTEVTLPAAPNAAEGYEFTGWKVGTEETLKQPQESLKVSANVTVTAQWKAIPLHLTFSEGTQNGAIITFEDGSNNPKDSYIINDTVKFKVTAKPGYKLVMVTSNGSSSVLSAGDDGYYSVTFKTAKDISVSAMTREVSVGAEANEAEGIKPDVQKTEDRTQATVTVDKPSKDGWRFDGWTIEVTGAEYQVDKDGSTVTITLANDDVYVTYTAKWTKLYTLKVEGVENATVSEHNDVYAEGETVTITITAKNGYELDKIEVTGAPVEAQGDTVTLTFGEGYEDTVTITATITAVYTLTENISGQAKIEYVSGQKTTYRTGDVVKFKVTAEKGYKISSVTAPNGTLTGPDDQGVYTLTFTTNNVTLTVTATVNYGSATEPLSITEVLYLAQDIEDLGKNEFTGQQVWAKGNVKENPASNELTLVDPFDDTKYILVYKPTGISLDVIAQNDILIVYGWVENYNAEKLEFTGFAGQNKDFPEIKSRTAGQSTITLGEHEGATVEKFGSSETLTAMNDTTFSFTVEPVAGKKVGKVIVGDQILTADNGNTYSFTVKGNATITINIVDESEETITTLYTLTTPYVAYESGGLQSSYTEAYDLEVDGITWSIEGNLTIEGSGWAFGGKNAQKADRKLTSKNPIKGKVTEIRVTLGGQDSQLTFNSFTLKVYNGDPYNGGQVIDTKTIPHVANSTNTVTADKEWKDCYYEFIFNVTTDSSNRRVFLKQIAFDGVKSTGGTTEPGGDDDAQDKVNAAIEWLDTQIKDELKVQETLTNSEKESETFNLPTEADNGVKFTWKISKNESGITANVTEAGVLTVTFPTEGSGGVLELTATPSYNEKTYSDHVYENISVPAHTSTGGGEESQTQQLEITASNITLPQNAASYSAYSNQTVNGDSSGVKFSYYFAHDTSGHIQARYSPSKGSSYLYNTVQFPNTIVSVVITWATDTQDGAKISCAFGSSEQPSTDGVTAQNPSQADGNYTASFINETGTDCRYLNITFAGNASYITSILITYKSSSSSSGGSDTDADQQKVDAAKESFALTDEQKTYSEAKTYDLPTTWGGVQISWELKETSTYCTIENNYQLEISSLPSEDTEVQLTATFSLNGKTATNDYTITIKKQIGGGGGDTEVKTWQKLTDAADLVEGAQIVLVSGTYFNKGSITTGSKGRLEVVSDSKWSAGSQNLPTDAQAITLEKHKGASGYEDYWLFKLGDKYLYLTGTSSNSTMALETSVPSKDNNGYFWGIALDTSNNVTITNKLGTSNCVLRFNSSGTSYWFANYSSTASQAKPDIYILKAASSDEAADDMEVVNAVYTMAGNVTPSDTGTSPILWISLISVGAVLISLGAVVVIFALRKKSE